MEKIYIIGVGGIGISAVARYYNENGYKVYGSDKNNSALIEKLQSEGIDIIIGERPNFIDNSFFKIIYTEAIPNNQEEFVKSKNLGINTLNYPQALADIVNQKKLITIAGTHGKSTTTSLISLVLKNSELGINSIVGTILKEFDNKNTYFSKSPYFVIEACEYKRSFLNYKPYVGVITNIEADHLDYYKDLDDYISGFDEYINNIVQNGYLIINSMDKNCTKLIGKRDDINYIEINNEYFIYKNEIIKFPKINMQVPGDHILFDAHIAYIVGYMFGLEDEKIINTLENYTGVWRRMEKIKTTKNNNTIISDYGHHPTEIRLTLKALKDKSPIKPILTIFQPHQYNRTIELLQDFKTCFYDTDMLIIPNIYESRDSKEDKEKINTQILVDEIKHDDKHNGNGFENTINMIKKWDQENNDGLIILMGAGDIDDLRYKL